MIFREDVVALGAAALVAAGLAAAIIYPGVYLRSEPMGYLQGKVLAYEVIISQSGTRGYFHLRLGSGDTLRVSAAGSESTVVPGDRVCVRTSRLEDMMVGDLVAMGRCLTAD